MGFEKLFYVMLESTRLLPRNPKDNIDLIKLPKVKGVGSKELYLVSDKVA